MCLDAETRRCLASMSRLPLQLVCTARDCTPKQMESRLNLPKGQEEQVVGKHSAVGQGNSLFSDGRKRLANGPPGKATKGKTSRRTLGNRLAPHNLI